MTPATTLMAYSMTKTITAIAVLQLAESGSLSLDATAAEYLPEWPYDAGVRVRELLAHLGGLPNPIPLRWVHPAEEQDTFDEHEALIQVLRRHGRANSAPGERFRYSNIGYWVLGAIVEQVTGVRFADHVEQRLLQPLGLTAEDAGFRVADISNHATGYLARWAPMNLVGRWLIDRRLLDSYDGTWRRIEMHYANGPAFGGLVGTASAFGRLLQDQIRPKSVLLGVQGRAWLCEMQSTHRGAPVPMTLGWHVGVTNGKEVYFKEGGGCGFRCLMRICPALRRGSVVMTNSTDFDVRSCLDASDGLQEESAQTYGGPGPRTHPDGTARGSGPHSRS